MAIWSKEVFAKNLRYYMERKGKTQKELAEIVGVSAPTMNDWIKAKKYPRIDKIEILADYFGILKSDLIEEKTQEHHDMKKKNDILSDIILKMRTDADFMSAVEPYISWIKKNYRASTQCYILFLSNRRIKSRRLILLHCFIRITSSSIKVSLCFCSISILLSSGANL
jgi:transcriptional regulator with XRE-family HTH domain